MDYSYYPSPSRRMAVFGSRGMVATSQQLAAQAGLEILKDGGNAVDAAVATAAALTVVEPCMNGIGGDAFAILWMDGKMFGLNSTGPAPALLSAGALREKGFDSMPEFGLCPVTVPGAPAAWSELCSRFGRMTLRQALRPAIEYASEGFAVSPVVAALWKEAAEKTYAPYKTDPQFAGWYPTFTKEGRAPRAGEKMTLLDHAKTLFEIASSDAESFYRGPLAERIDAFSREAGGFLRKEDLAGFEPEWVSPLRVGYRGHDVWELPPNGQGMIALIGLGILDGLSVPAKDDPERWHLLIEALKLAAADGYRYVCDPRWLEFDPVRLLDPAYLAERRALIGGEARIPEAGAPKDSGTVYLCTADGEGNMVSYIQSNYQGFGSGVVVPGTGIALHNRGYGFSLDPKSPNFLQPGKRPFHTLIPGFLSKDGKPLGPFGVMGAAMQPQGHMQVLSNLIDQQMNPQAALDEPRFMWTGGKRVIVEPGTPEAVAAALARKGHEIEYSLSRWPFGRGQMILRTGDGTLAGATEPRADGAVAAW